MSDHSAMTLTLNNQDKQPFGPSYWTFNSGLLDDPLYVDLSTTKYYEWRNRFIDIDGSSV